MRPEIAARIDRLDDRDLLVKRIARGFCFGLRCEHDFEASRILDSPTLTLDERSLLRLLSEEEQCDRRTDDTYRSNGPDEKLVFDTGGCA